MKQYLLEYDVSGGSKWLPIAVTLLAADDVAAGMLATRVWRRIRHERDDRGVHPEPTLFNLTDDIEVRWKASS